MEPIVYYFRMLATKEWRQRGKAEFKREREDRGEQALKQSVFWNDTEKRVRRMLGLKMEQGR